MVVLCLCGVWYSMLGEVGQGSFVVSGVQIQGWMMGQDMVLGSYGMLGFVFGEICSVSICDWGNDRGCDCQLQVQLYVGWQYGWVYVLGQVGVGQFICDIDCQLLLGVGQYGVNVCYGGSFSMVSMELGYWFGSIVLLFMLYFGVEYVWVDSDCFSENGGVGFGLCMQGGIVSCSQVLVGVCVQVWWGDWLLCGYVEWQQYLVSYGFDLQVSFVGVDVWVLLVGLQLVWFGGLFGVLVELWFSWNMCVLFGYDQCVGLCGDLYQVVLCYVFVF